MLHKSNYRTDHKHKRKQISVCNVHKHRPSFLLQVGGWNIALSVPWVSILCCQGGGPGGAGAVFALLNKTMMPYLLSQMRK